MDVLAVREVALCVKYAGRLFILTPLKVKRCEETATTQRAHATVL